MSPLEVRTAREIEEATDSSRVKLIQPGKSKTISPKYFGLNDGFAGEKIQLKMSCDINDNEGEVILFRKKGSPHDIEEVHYKVRRGRGKKYINERGHKILRIEMK